MSQDKIYFDPANKQIHLTDNSSHLIWREAGPTPPVSYDDWFLPSRDETDAMRTNLYDSAIGDFGTGFLWTSSEASSSTAYGVRFSDGLKPGLAKSSNTPVRPARTFIDTVGTYEIGDVGPAGGWIFYISGGTTYYEAAPYDLNDPFINWSNIQNVAVTGTGTAIGTGASNTTKIIEQLSHTSSKAQSCVDLVIVT